MPGAERAGDAESVRRGLGLPADRRGLGTALLELDVSAGFAFPAPSPTPRFTPDEAEAFVAAAERSE